MIHLTLTQQDTERLHYYLTRLQQLSPDDTDDVLCLLHKLQQAQIDATIKRHCLTCTTPFAQDVVGRKGRYCSKACKQKAYRQRINDRKRQSGPPRPT